MTERLAERISGVRAFNRMYTGVVGALDEGLVGTEYTLGEARVLFELAQAEQVAVADLRRTMNLDAGYASRLLGRLAERGLLTRERSDTDARQQVVGLTEQGRQAHRSVEQRTVTQVGALLGTLTEEDQRRLLSSMRTIDRLVGTSSARKPVLVLRPPRPGDLGWVMHRHGVLYAQEYGWGRAFETMVARIVTEYAEQQDDTADGPAQAGWIAELDGERAGSVFCTRGKDPHTAKLRLLLVEPSARGFGVGRRLVTECVEFARGSGYRSLELLTNSVLTAARAIYRGAGFELVGTEEDDSLVADPTWETWRLTL